MSYRTRVVLECLVLFLIALTVARLGHLNDRYQMNWDALTCFQTRDVIIPE